MVGCMPQIVELACLRRPEACVLENAQLCAPSPNHITPMKTLFLSIAIALTAAVSSNAQTLQVDSIYVGAHPLKCRMLLQAPLPSMVIGTSNPATR